MIICGNCQFTNPADHRFCQQCGEPLSAPNEAPLVASVPPALQVRLMPPAKVKLAPATYLAPTTEAATTEDTEGRYQVLTVLSQDRAQVKDTMPEVRSPIQQQLTQLTDSTSAPSLATLQAVPTLPAAAYPYLLLTEAAPHLYDAWEWNDTTLIIVPERPAITSIIKAFSTAVDPLQPVYWMYRLIELWTALAPIPQWRSSLLLADNLGIDTDQSLLIQRFIPPASEPNASLPQLSDLKVFLQSLLAQPHRGEVASLRQIRQLILAVSSAKTLEQLSRELADIGKALLSTPAAITPTAAVVSSSGVPAVSETKTAAFSALPVPITLPPKVSAVNMTPSEDTVQAPLEDVPEKDAPGKDALEKDTLEQDMLEDTVLQEDSLNLPHGSEGDEVTMVLPMKLVSLSDAGQTDVGHQRDHNEDCFFIERNSQKRSDNSGQSTAARGLYILCDGMGGHDGGEVASQLAAQTLTQYFGTHWPAPVTGETPAPLPEKSTMIEAVKLANQAIYEVNDKEQRAGHERMGTTLVMVLLQGTAAVVAHVGDSRLYKHSRRVGLVQVTTDHEVGQREIQRGVDPEIAYGRPDALQLTQALGPRDSADLEPSVDYLTFSEDTLLLLCSDGLSDNDLVEDYLDSHIDPLLREKVGLEKGLNDLVALANEVNGHDNISAIAINLKVRPDLNRGALGNI